MAVLNGHTLLLILSFLSCYTEQLEFSSLSMNNKSLPKHFLSVEQTTFRDVLSAGFNGSVLKELVPIEKKSYSPWGRRFETSASNAGVNEDKAFFSSKHKSSESEVDKDQQHNQKQKRKLLFSLENVNQISPSEDHVIEFMKGLKDFQCGIEENGYDSWRKKRSEAENKNFVPWGGKKREFIGRKEEYVRDNMNDGKSKEMRSNYNAWGGKRADTVNYKPLLSTSSNGKHNYKEEGSTEFKNQIRNFVLLANNGNRNSPTDESLSEIFPKTNYLSNKDYYYPQNLNECNIVKYSILNKIKLNGKKSQLFDKCPGFSGVNLNSDFDRGNSEKKSDNAENRVLLDDQKKSNFENARQGRVLTDSEDFIYNNKENAMEEEWTKPLEYVNDMTLQKNLYLRNGRTPNLSENGDESNITDKYASASNPYRNLRNFEPWAGKRNDNSQPGIIFRTKKRNYTRVNSLEAKNEELINEKIPQTLKNLRSFRTWGEKRGYSRWGGKRFSESKENALSNVSWTGKQKIEHSNGIHEFFFGNFKKRFYPYNGLQLSFNQMPGANLLFAKGDINTWVNKTRKFNSWGGKRTLLLK